MGRSKESKRGGYKSGVKKEEWAPFLVYEEGIGNRKKVGREGIHTCLIQGVEAVSNKKMGGGGKPQRGGGRVTKH